MFRCSKACVWERVPNIQIRLRYITHEKLVYSKILESGFNGLLEGK